MNHFKLFLSGVFNLAFVFAMHAQERTQTIRGIVSDQVSQTPLPGVSILLLHTDPLKVTATDSNGFFKITGVQVGRQAIKFSMLGYRDFYIANIDVASGKEVVLDIKMEQKVYESKEVVITGKLDKSRPVNDMSVVSTRTFSVEETQKYAAAVNDPLRMAMSFPGVVQTIDGNNTISIRGNSPNGLLWRMEGVEIPNPNHFSSLGMSGGGISIVSAQLLSNSDFSTGAFPAEYGNALSGVFDLKLRHGNNEKTEYTFQASVIGIDAAVEGPFKKGYEGSYLINYRYSTLNLLNKIGIGNQNSDFQDLSFNFYFPTKKLGTFTLFGFGGLSSHINHDITDSLEKATKDIASTGAVGLTHSKTIGTSAFLKTILLISGTGNGERQTEYDYYPPGNHDNYYENFSLGKITLSTTLNNKLSAKSSLRSGAILNQLRLGLFEQSVTDASLVLHERTNYSTTSYTIQAFSEWKYNISQRLTSIIGVHYFRFLLNNSSSTEPRVSLKYDLSPTQSLSAAYGLHSQLQPFDIYFLETTNQKGNSVRNNESLGFSKAHHYVVSYDKSLNEYLHLKMEAYYQYLFNIPVSTDPQSTYSILNSHEGFRSGVVDKLVNSGTGRNYGLELTVEQYTFRNIYLLGSASLYDSRYRANNGKLYNTMFDGNYAFTFTAGKEKVLSQKHKGKIIGCNTKIFYIGGLRTTPVNTIASDSQKSTVYDYGRSFESQNPAYFRIDIRVSMKRNYAKVTTTLALDVQNMTNRRNVVGTYYDYILHQTKYTYQGGIIPVLSYRVEF